jgi:acylphosphatase
MHKIYRIRISGKVQGVYFREGTKGVADLLRIKGWIRNEEDGSVLMEIKGDLLALEDFWIWCHEGPDRAKVELVDIKELEMAMITLHNSIKHPFLNFDIIK